MQLNLNFIQNSKRSSIFKRYYIIIAVITAATIIVSCDVHYIDSRQTILLAIDLTGVYLIAVRYILSTQIDLPKRALFYASEYITDTPYSISFFDHHKKCNEQCNILQNTSCIYLNEKITFTHNVMLYKIVNAH